jgi:hypothetical protein
VITAAQIVLFLINLCWKCCINLCWKCCRTKSFYDRHRKKTRDAIILSAPGPSHFLKSFALHQLTTAEKVQVELRYARSIKFRSEWIPITHRGVREPLSILLA